MSFSIGQFRKDSLSGASYIQPITNCSVTTVTTDWSSSESSDFNITFYDTALSLNQSLQQGHFYFLKVEIERQTLRQRISINLKNDSAKQTISSFLIPAGLNLQASSNKIAVLETVIAPNQDYNIIVLQLQRQIPDDFQNSDRQVNIVSQGTGNNKTYNYVLGEFTNILTNIGCSSFTKMGIQGPPGLLMCINGEDIRIGPSGIYEIKNGYKITNMGIAILDSNNNSNNFIIDYQYENV